jgi:tRNA/tmRNA/rRNA uracil-C5-methylase (TrmA/RlmC/RlmD family)
MPFRKNPYDFTYVDTVQHAAGDGLAIRGVAPLAALAYDDELALKQKAFAEYIRLSKVEGHYEDIIPSPFKRHYRTTTKRRVVFSTGTIQFRFGEGSGDFPDQDRNETLLEPKQHNVIYSFLLDILNEKLFVPVGKRCNYIVIRGSYKEFCVIFNMHQLDGTVVRRIKSMAEKLSKLDVNVISSFIVSNPARSRYYLDSKNNDAKQIVKKLYGPETLRFTSDDLTYLYDAMSFSQINQSMVPLMMKKAGTLLDIQNPLNKGFRLIDLYCGYGLFALYAGRYFSEVFGIDSDQASLDRANESVRHCKDFSKAIKVRFTSGQITAHVLETVLPVGGDKPEIVILDPPRMGVEKGVIGALAFRKPKKVLHIFCNADLIPSELEQWKKLGYSTKKIVPLDMFPGTAHLEVMVLLEQR